MNTKPDIKTIGYLLIPLVLWAGNSVVGKYATAFIGPFSLSFYRWLIASVILLLIAGKALYLSRHELRNHWRELAILGIVGTGLYNTLLYFGLTSTSASNSGIVMATMPILIIGLNFIIGYERIHLLQIVGLITSLLGVLWVVTEGDFQKLVTLDLNGGDLIVFAAVITWALYSVLLRRLRPSTIGSLPFLAIQFLIGLAFIFPLHLYEQAHHAPIIWQSETILILLYVGIFPSLFAYYFWQQGIALGGANIAGLLYPFISILTAVFAYFLLGESLNQAQSVGIVLVFAGVGLSILSPRHNTPSQKK